MKVPIRRRALEVAMRPASPAAAVVKKPTIQPLPLSRDGMCTAKETAVRLNAGGRLGAQSHGFATTGAWSGQATRRPPGGWLETNPPPIGRTHDDLAFPTPAKPVAALVPSIDRSQMSIADKVIVGALHLDTMALGQSTTAKIKVTAELAAVLGVKVGATASLSIYRSSHNPNEFSICMSGLGELSGVATGDTAGFGANAGLGASAGASVTIKVDLSKGGAATELAAFAAQVGVMTAVATAVPGVGGAAVGLLNAIERLPGVNLPGEPIDYIVDHLSSIQGVAGGAIKGSLGAALGPAIKGIFVGYLNGTGRVDFNDDGTLTLTGNVTAGEVLVAWGGVGAAGASAQVLVGYENANIGFQRSVTLKPGSPPQILSEGYSALISVGGTIGAGAVSAGGKATVTVALDDLPANFKDLVSAALLRGDTQAAAQVIAEAAQTGKLKASLNVRGTMYLEGKLDLDGEEVGVGGDLTLDGTLSTSVPIAYGSVTFGAKGIVLESAMLGYPAGSEISWDQLGELASSADPSQWPVSAPATPNSNDDEQATS